MKCITKLKEILNSDIEQDTYSSAVDRFIHLNKEYSYEDIVQVLCPQDFNIPCKYNNITCVNEVKSCESCWNSKIEEDIECQD